MKKTGLSLISLSFVLVMLFTLAACSSSGPYDGMYVNKEGTESVKLSGSKWTAYNGEEAVFSGRFEVDKETGAIVLFLADEKTGREHLFDAGSIEDGVLDIKRGTFYLEGGKKAADVGEGIDANSLANALSSALADYD